MFKLLFLAFPRHKNSAAFFRPDRLQQEQSHHHPPLITIFRGDMATIASHGWFMTLFYSLYVMFLNIFYSTVVRLLSVNCIVRFTITIWAFNIAFEHGNMAYLLYLVYLLKMVSFHCKLLVYRRI